jgi:hypothetical protein
MRHIDANTLINKFINKLVLKYPAVAVKPGDYISVTSNQAGSTDYNLKFIDRTDMMLSEDEKKEISRIFYEAKSGLM